MSLEPKFNLETIHSILLFGAKLYKNGLIIDNE